MIKINHYHQKKEKVVIKIKKYLIFLIAFFVGLWGFFWLPYFQISEVKVQNDFLQKKQIEEKLNPFLTDHYKFFLPKNNFFLFSGTEAEKFLLKNGFGFWKIKKVFFHTIYADFTETKPEFLYCQNSECFYVDKNGIPYEMAPFFSQSPFALLDLGKNAVLGEEFLSKNRADFLISFEKKIENKLKIKKVEIKEDMKITFGGDWFLILQKEEQDAEKIYKNLFLLLENKIKDRSKIEYIDFRFTNKAFYKIRD